MRGESKDESKEQDTKTYSYNRCPTCDVKLHVYANKCWKCGGKIEMLIYHSQNKDDEIYSMNLNSVERCMKCHNVLHRGKICERIICFGTGSGSCEYCRRTEGIRYECCQQEQKEKGTYRSFIEEIKGIMRDSSKTPGPMAKILVEALQPQSGFEDEVPF